MNMHKPLFILAAFLVSFAGSDLQSWQSPEYIEKAFIEIALKDEYRSTQMRVSKWERPIRYTFVYRHLSSYAPFEKMVHMHMAQLMDITGHSIDYTDQTDHANFKIVVTKDQYYQQTIERFTHAKIPDLSKETNCMATIHHNARHAIDQAVVVIPIDYAVTHATLPACIVEELTQSMGLPNDSDWVYPSIANDASKIELLSGLDYILLKLLYSPELKAGMPLEQTRKVIRKEIHKLAESGEIARANQIVKQKGLYPLLN